MKLKGARADPTTATTTTTEITSTTTTPTTVTTPITPNTVHQCVSVSGNSFQKNIGLMDCLWSWEDLWIYVHLIQIFGAGPQRRTEVFQKVLAGLKRKNLKWSVGWVF